MHLLLLRGWASGCLGGGFCTVAKGCEGTVVGSTTLTAAKVVTIVPFSLSVQIAPSDPSPFFSVQRVLPVFRRRERGDPAAASAIRKLRLGLSETRALVQFVRDETRLLWSKFLFADPRLRELEEILRRVFDKWDT